MTYKVEFRPSGGEGLLILTWHYSRYCLDPHYELWDEWPQTMYHDLNLLAFRSAGLFEKTMEREREIWRKHI